MIADGSSSPADLVILPLLFVVAFLAVSAVCAVWRRLAVRRRPAREPQERRPMGVPAAVGRLRAAGIDPDALLGPWLLEERRAGLAERSRHGRDQESTLEFN
ncbi:hypothetical protein [Actinocorallia populi]|uniref:hypothetical protein n=1 Tax=Actinocorallia populi TaxID=2079200 RepID=UPI000D096B27|nr:hypothetical protein [Actinocorallia populi]